MMASFDNARADDLPQLVELLGILFTQEHELAPDAAKQLRGLRLILLTDCDNFNAQRLYERAGFLRSGMLPMRLKLLR